MDDQATATRHDKEQCEETPLVPTKITVTVTPDSSPVGKELPCTLAIQPKNNSVDDTLWINPTDDYEIHFDIAPASARTWDTGTPFGNQKGHCPNANGGPKDNFTVTANGTKGIIVNVPAQKGRAVQHYRLNFDSGYTCDPIIVVGLE